MSFPVIFCPGGPISQSGAAVKARYPNTPIESCGKIPDVINMLQREDGPFVVPIWNSHEGEVKTASYIWNSIENESIKIGDFWAKDIDFWFVRRVSPRTSHGEVGSVAVAETQCSGFLQTNSLHLVKCDLTTTALEEYRQGAAWDGVLVAPNQGEEPNFEVVAKTTANPNNFTSFVRLVPSRAFVNDAHSLNTLTGVRMRAFDVNLGTAEADFFDRMLDKVSSMSELPKLIFVFDRDSKVGLLFEGARLNSADLLDAEQLEDDSVSVFEVAGLTNGSYSSELQSLFDANFPALSNKDFIKHSGIKTCLFACPPLGIYIHGYNEKRVEPVVRFYISKLFALWNDEVLKCDDTQKQFFERYVEAWDDKKSDFIEFEIVAAT